MTSKLAQLATEIRACRLCAESLPLGPRPVLYVSRTARLRIVGQAPGTKVHETGIPWNDRSGDRLRDWLRLDKETFYDAARIAITPMGFCYPGRDANGGDKPPRPECAPWQERLTPLMPGIALTLLVGSHAQAHYLRDARKATMTETVAHWRDYMPRFMPLPHPSWRNTSWLKKNPWFEDELLPVLRAKVRALMKQPR
jgi:uracil-DNA glycosylase